MERGLGQIWEGLRIPRAETRASWLGQDVTQGCSDLSVCPRGHPTAAHWGFPSDLSFPLEFLPSVHGQHCLELMGSLFSRPLFAIHGAKRLVSA